MTDTTEIAEQVFDPTKVDTKSPNIRLDWGTWVTGDGASTQVENHFGFFVTWIRNFDLPSDDATNIRPEWADSHVKDRIWRELDAHLVRDMTYTNLRNHSQLGLHVNLPCPPYNYEQDGHKLIISSGPYRLAGTRAEWKTVMEEMETEVDEMPEGIDVSDMYVRASGTVAVSWSVNVPVTELLDGDDEMGDDGMWLGDEEDMQARACEAFEENATDHIESSDFDDYGDMEDVYVSESYVD